MDHQASSTVDVPSFFLCPISLQIMRDPVTLPTGITYDRHSIERWVFTSKQNTCPMTKQPLQSPATDDCDAIITPNHTLRRLIQAWCVANASADGIERFPTPKPPVTRAQIADLVEDARSNPPQSLAQSLRKLKHIVSESERNRRCVESSGAVDFLASVVETYEQDDEGGDDVLAEALNILYCTKISKEGLAQLLDERANLIETLTAILRRSSSQCRAYSTLLLKSIVPAAPAQKLMGLKDAFFVEIVNVLRDCISYQSTKAALQILVLTSTYGRNKLKVVEAGAVPVLVELLLDESEKKWTEMMLVVLSRLSECAEGRAEIVGHAAGIAVVAKKLVRVSVLASEMAVKVMHSIARFSPTSAVLREMMEVGAVSKLCLLIQVDCGAKTKEKVKEILSLHARVWRNSPCISPQLQTSYPC